MKKNHPNKHQYGHINKDLGQDNFPKKVSITNALSGNIKKEPLGLSNGSFSCIYIQITSSHELLHYLHQQNGRCKHHCSKMNYQSS